MDDDAKKVRRFSPGVNWGHLANILTDEQMRYCERGLIKEIHKRHDDRAIADTIKRLSAPPEAQ